MSNDQLGQFLSGARSNISVVIPWFIDPLTARAGLQPALDTPGAVVEIFFLDPTSPYLAERGRVARPDITGYGASETKRSMLMLADSFVHARASAKLMLYSSLPPAFIVHADNKGLIGFHFHTAVALSNPILFFDIERQGQFTEIGRTVDQEFQKLRTVAKEIDLASVKEGPNGEVSYKVN